jgi:hypothetical protein
MLHITAQSFQQSEKYHTLNSGASAYRIKVYISFPQSLLILITREIKEEAEVTNIVSLTNKIRQVVSLPWPIGNYILQGDNREGDEEE